MTKTYTAQVSQRRGRWHLYVVLPDAPGFAWPDCLFAGTAVPTLAERSEALNALGYVFTNGAEWRWVEDSETPDDPSSPVHLIASIAVEEVP